MSFPTCLELFWSSSWDVWVMCLWFHLFCPCCPVTMSFIPPIILFGYARCPSSVSLDDGSDSIVKCIYILNIAMKKRTLEAKLCDKWAIRWLSSISVHTRYIGSCCDVAKSTLVHTIMYMYIHCIYSHSLLQCQSAILHVLVHTSYFEPNRHHTDKKWAYLIRPCKIGWQAWVYYTRYPLQLSIEWSE